jgi:hypothetical protein
MFPCTIFFLPAKSKNKRRSFRTEILSRYPSPYFRSIRVEWAM